MAPLPSKPMPTVDAILAKREDDQDDGYRNHLGASIIGHPCPRSLWYSFRWATRRRHEGRMLRLFETGHLAEARFIAELRSIGVEVFDVDPNTGAQFTVRDESGHFGGSLDGVALGILEAPKAWHVCEFKTHNAKSFKRLTDQGVKVSKKTHWCQMQIYMHFTGIDRAFYFAANKDTDELYSERVHYDMEAATRLVALAQWIVSTSGPPEKISYDPSWHECRFCDHQAVCHGGALPEAHCRSCMHSTPVEEGKWTCEPRGEYLSGMAQRRGCERHLYIPALVHGEQVDCDPMCGWITYQMRDGTQWTDGVPF